MDLFNKDLRIALSLTKQLDSQVVSNNFMKISIILCINMYLVTSFNQLIS